MKDKLDLLIQNAKEQIATVEETAALQLLKVQFLGKSGEIATLSRGMKDVSKEDRPKIGVMLNDARNILEELFATAEERISNVELNKRLIDEKIDISIPGQKQCRGALHPQTLVRRELCEIFAQLGYEIIDGAEIETDYYCFEALNIPKDHPAREMQDTFYITEEFLLRSQTSTAQIHAMQNGKLPIKIISPGRVYRSDDIDATHSPMFHQIEGLLIDEGITLCDLKGTLLAFAKKFFGQSTQIRFRPSFFPFTEPSIEVDASCYNCGGKGCRICKGTGWIEIMGAGMVNTKVLDACGIDSSKYSGFAFGMGLDRATNIKYGISDLRVVFENDVRFLKQFKN